LWRLGISGGYGEDELITSGGARPQAARALAWGVGRKLRLDCSKIHTVASTVATVAKGWPGALLDPGSGTAHNENMPTMCQCKISVLMITTNDAKAMTKPNAPLQK
jgi:hypothetical protein